MLYFTWTRELVTRAKQSAIQIVTLLRVAENVLGEDAYGASDN
jgi:hypothetical protein